MISYNSITSWGMGCCAASLIALVFGETSISIMFSVFATILIIVVLTDMSYQIRREPK